MRYKGRDVIPRISKDIGVIPRMPARLRGYLRENWGSPFVAVFMVLLLTAAGYLAMGLERTANLLAEYAYYSLVIGVILQFTCYLKHGGDGG